MATIDDFYEELGFYLVERVRKEIKTPRQRFTKSPRGMKRNSPYNMYATGNLWRSVEAKTNAELGEILILMEDYGVNYVFNPDPELGGSFPGGGRFYPDTRPKGQKKATSSFITELTKWAKAKFNLPEAKAKGMAFAVRKNLFKSGFAGIPLFTEELLNDFTNHAQKLLEKPEYQEEILPDEIQRAVDSIFTLGKETYEIGIL
jgi:hypothetical protein